MLIPENLQKLNPSKFVASDREVINSWKNEAIKLAEQDDFRSHPVTQNLVGIVNEEIARINDLLMNSEDMTEELRRQLFAERKEHSR